MIRLSLVLLANVIRLAFNKLHYGARYKSNLIERISPHASLALYGHGSIWLGRNIELAPYVDIQVHGRGKLSIGERVYMNRCCMISCQGKVSIGNGCMFGPGVKIFDNNHHFAKDKGVSTRLNVGSVIIGNNCWIASDVILLKGTDIGDNCVIGAGCIVNSKIPANSIVRNNKDISIEPLR